MKSFVHVIFRNQALVGPICLKYWREALNLAYIPFGVWFMAHCIHCEYGHSGVDWKDKLFYFLYVAFM